MTFSIIHLSDIHFKTKEDIIIINEDKIFNAIKNELRHVSHCFIIITGDIAFSGQDSEYEIAAGFIDNISMKLKKYNNGLKIDIVLIPGNHDCDFNKDTSTRKTIINSINSGATIIDEDIIDTCTSIQSSYFKFAEKYQTSITKLNPSNKLLSVVEYQVGK